MLIKENDDLLIIDAKKGKRWIVPVEKGKRFAFYRGILNFDEIIEKVPFGSVYRMGQTHLLLLKPTALDYLAQYRHATNIIYQEDAAMITALTGISDGMRVLEAGSGSGGLTTFLANAIRPNGKVYSYETRIDHLKVAIKNLTRSGLLSFVEFYLADIRTTCFQKELDAVILDFTTPWEAIDTAMDALKYGGHLIVFVPNWSQIENTVKRMKKTNELWILDIFELIRRDFRVDPSRQVMRPVNRIIGYTAVIIHAIKVKPVPKNDIN